MPVPQLSPPLPRPACCAAGRRGGRRGVPVCGGRPHMEPLGQQRHVSWPRGAPAMACKQACGKAGWLGGWVAPPAAPRPALDDLASPSPPHSLPTPSPWFEWHCSWVIISVMVTLEPSMGAGLRKAWLRVVGTVAGGLAGLAALYLAFAAAGGKDWEGEDAARCCSGWGAGVQGCGTPVHAGARMHRWHAVSRHASAATPCLQRSAGRPWQAAPPSPPVALQAAPRRWR